MAVQAALYLASNAVAGAFTIGAHVGITAPAQRAAGYEVNYALPNELPPASMIVQAWRAGYLNYADMQWGVRCLGIVPPNARPVGGTIIDSWWRKFQRVWDGSFKTTVNVPATGEMLVCLNRNLTDEAQTRQWLAHSGFVNPEVQNALLNLRFQIPGPSDLIRYAVREGWDTNTVNRFGYDQEFPPELQFWMDRQGMGSDARTDAQRQAGAPRVTWPLLEWRSHWQVISPGQAYEMFHRLRPERIANFQAQFPGVQPFTLADLTEVLKIADYPPAFRDRLAALSTRPPRIRDVQAWYELGIIDGPEVEAIARDYQYSPENARRRRAQVEELAHQKIINRLHVNTKATTLASYREGILSRTEAAVQLYGWAVIGTYRHPAWLAMNRQQQEQTATTDVLVNIALDSEDANQALKDVRVAVATVKKAYLRGLMDVRAASQVLNVVGISAARETELITEWDRAKFAGQLIASTANIKKWYERGIIPALVAQNYLRNLGWRAAEVGALLLEWNQDIAMMLAKAQEKVAKTLAQRQAALVKQIKEANRQKQLALNKLNATMSPSMAHRYYVKGVIDKATLKARLIVFDYKGAALDAALKEADIDRQAYLDKRAKDAGKSGGGGTGTGGGKDGKAKA